MGVIGEPAIFSSLQMYLKFEGNANDSSASGNNGTDVNTPTYSTTAARYNQSITYAKASSEQTNFGNIFSLVGTTNSTYSFWYKTTTSGLNDTVVGYYSTTAGGGWDISLQSTNKIALQTYNGGGATSGSAVSSQTVNDGKWHWVVAIQSGSTTGQVYIDGLGGSTAAIAPITPGGPTRIFNTGGNAFIYGFSDCSMDNMLVDPSNAWTQKYIRKYYTQGVGRLAPDVSM